MMKSMICASAFVFSCAVSANAGQFDTPRQTVVRYDDINVRESAGALILLARIEAATKDVCGPAPDLRDLGAWERFRACTKTARDKAVASLPFDLTAAMNNNSAMMAQR
jgi:UrcA family protein